MPSSPPANRADPWRARLLATLRVQYPDTLAERGFRLLDPRTGDPYTADRRHLVATCRATANFALGALASGPDWCVSAAEHGLSFLQDGHRGEEGYHLVVTADGDPVDRTRSAYGHAFVLLACARATEAGLEGARSALESTHRLIEDRFLDDRGMLGSDRDAVWNELEPYRGQNANMHACEAYLAAYEATGEEAYLDRARHLARTITVDLAAATDGRLWEHYTADWEHNFTYNESEPRHQFRPPGYQPGHHLEWAKLLALLDRYGDAPGPAEGWYARALSLFDRAVADGWTENGFIYTHGHDGSPIVSDQYGWALAEAIAASGALTERAAVRDKNGMADTASRLRRLNRRFTVCTDLYRGPAGVWHEKRLAPEAGGDLVAPEPPGVEPDYHPVGAFYECWRSVRAMSPEAGVDPPR